MVPGSAIKPARRGRTIRVLLAALGSALTAVLAFASPALADVTGTVHTDSGVALTVRSGPHVSSTAVGSVADGASISIDCQTYGDTVTGKYGTSNIWDHVPAKGGYVTDTYVYTGSDTLVAPLCAGTPTYTCSTSGLGDPRTCSEAVSWAESHISTSYNSDYYGRCDHVVALAYGWSASGSTTAYNHWLAVPSSYKHGGDSNVPAGGLAFFSGGSTGAGHVMISVGGGKFASTDIGGAGTYTYTTIATIESKWGEHYLGWTQPWFQINH
jgi:uncharacterized protein YraI